MATAISGKKHKKTGLALLLGAAALASANSHAADARAKGGETEPPPVVFSLTQGARAGLPSAYGLEGAYPAASAVDWARYPAFGTVMETEAAFPSTLCELVDNNHGGAGVAGAGDTTAASFSELLSWDSRTVGTGLGYDLGPGLRVQGFGVFDSDESSAFAGPALRFNPVKHFGVTTGVQMLLSENNSGLERPDLFFAEFRLLF